MGIRRNRLLSAGLSAVVVVLAMSGTGIQASASSVSGPNLSTPQGIDQYLQSRGINPDAVIRQTGPKNYVGNHCPGTGWHCLAPTHTPVVQIAPAGGVNEFTCSPGTGGSGSCFVLQISGDAQAAGNAPQTSTGAVPAGNTRPVANEFNCYQQSSANPAALNSDTCGSMTQVSLYGGDNRATIVQAIAQRSAGAPSPCPPEPPGPTSTQCATETAGPFSQIQEDPSGGNNQITIGQASLQYSSDTPTSAQTVNVSQTNTSGQNQATVGQLEQQQVSDAALSQDQEGTQVACITQDSQSGPNVATVGQLMNQQEKDSAPSSTQAQNVNPGPYSTCGSENTSQSPNLAALVLQNQNAPATASGQNQANLDQTLKQLENTAAQTGTQQQGNSGAFTGGLEAIPAQYSTGLSKINADQDESQTMQAPSGSTVSQNQNDPIHQPPTGPDSQQGNPNDTFTLTQDGTQLASPGTAATQLYNIQGDCFSSGTCNVQQSATTNAGTTNQSCPPSPEYVCAEGLSNVEE